MSYRMNKRKLDFPVKDAGTKKLKRGARTAPLALSAMIKRAIGQQAESKEVLTAFGTTFNATQTYVTLLNGVAEGTDYTNRVGRSCTHRYLEVSIGIYSSVPNTSTAVLVPGDFGFWAVVYDRQPNGALAAFADIFDGSNGLGHRVTSKNQDRFKIIAREEWAVGGNQQAAAASIFASGACPYHMRRYIDMSRAKGTDSKTKFQGTGATIADIDEGSILFVAASYLSSATQNVVLNANVKYRFTDM